MTVMPTSSHNFVPTSIPAVHPTDSEKSAIISLLKDRFPQVLGTSFSVNPRLIGGLVIKVGDERLDYSLASQLANMQKGFI